jgi:DNA-directed RNA polymerase subunit H (RpoH/RPB5)
MLRDRKYSQLENFLNISPVQFDERFKQNRITIAAPHSTENKYAICHIVYNETQVKKEIMLHLVEFYMSTATEEQRKKYDYIYLIFIVPKIEHTVQTYITSDVNEPEKLRQKFDIENIKKDSSSPHSESDHKCYFKVELFNFRDMIINKTQHIFVPKHRLLTDEEVEKVTTALNVPKTTFPRILKTDAICKYYGGKSGDVFEITRGNIISGIELVYRIVV